MLYTEHDEEVTSSSIVVCVL